MNCAITSLANYTGQKWLNHQVLFLIIFLFAAISDTTAQKITKSQLSEIDKLWLQVYYSNWESPDSTKYWYPIAVNAIRTYPACRSKGKLVRYVARQTQFIELGLSKDSIRNTFHWLHYKLLGIDSIESYRAMLYQAQALWYNRHYQYDSSFYYINLALADSKVGVAKSNPKTYTNMLISLANNYNNAGYAIYQTTNDRDSQEKKASIAPKILYFFQQSDSLTTLINSLEKNACQIFNAAKLNIANVYGHYFVDRQLSNRYFKQVIEQAEACKDTIRLGQIYNALSLCVLNAGDTTHAIQAATICINHLRNADTSFPRIARFEANSILSKLYFHKHQYDSTIKYGKNVLSDTAFITRPIEVSFVSSVMAESYLKKKDYINAYKMLTVSYQYLGRNTSEKQQQSITGTFESDSESVILRRLDKVQNLINKSNNLNEIKITIVTIVVALLVALIVFFAIKLSKKSV